MIFSITTLALLASLIPSISAVPTTIQKRFTGATIRSGRTNTCLTLQGGVQIIPGSLLSVGNCATATKWDINPGSGSVIVSGSSFALDAGVPQGNNAVAKVWTSFPGSPQQTWYLTADNRIAVTGGNQCLDQGDNGPQTYQCSPGNTNQVWYVENGGGGPSSSSSASSSSASASSSSTPPPPAGGQIKWKANTNLCLTANGPGGDGVLVVLTNCFNPTSPSAGPQKFVRTGTGLIQLSGTNFCLDAGSNPANGVGMKLWTCYSGLAQQSWQTPDSGLVQTANNQCLNIDNSNFYRIQTWACSAPDPNQGWTFS